MIKKVYIFLCHLLYILFSLTRKKKITLFYDFEITKSKFKDEGIKMIDNHSCNVIKKIYIMASSKIIICDNYLVELACIDADETKVYLLWHASSAVKKFGIYEEKNFSSHDIKRFKKVYDRFDYIVVNSDYMIEIFKKYFQITDGSKFLKFGYHGLSNTINVDSNEEYILYLPTFREDGNYQPQIDFINNFKSQKYKIHYSLHPSVDISLSGKNLHQIKHIDIVEEIYNAKLVISDYSSLLMESVYLNGYVVGYCYDYEEYRKLPGLSLELKDVVDVYTSEIELVNYIEDGKFKNQKSQEFIDRYYSYSDVNTVCELKKHFLKGDQC